MWTKFGKFGSSAIKFGVSTAKLGFAIYFIQGEIGYISLAYGPSMMPTINPLNDLILVDVFSTNWLGRQYAICYQRELALFISISRIINNFMGIYAK